MYSSRPITFDRVVRVLATVLVIIIIFYLINMLRNVLLPFAVACLIAYMLEPLVNWHMRILKLKHRVIPVFLTLLEVSIVLGTILYFLIPSTIEETAQLIKLVKDSDAHTFMPGFLPDDIRMDIESYMRSHSIEKMLSGTQLESILNKSSSVLSATLSFLSHTLEWLLMFIYIIFIMLDYNPLMKGFRLMVPPRYRKVIYRVSDDIKNNMNTYFRSQAVIALCAAIFYCIGFSIVGIPMAIIMGITVGILYMIPYFQYITLIPVAILCYIMSITGEVSFWPEIGKCVLVYVISQSVCDYILTPKIMGKSLGLNPAIILLSLSVWGTLMGILGMILALPMTALLISYYNEFVLKRSVSTDLIETQTVNNKKGS